MIHFTFWIENYAKINPQKKKANQEIPVNMQICCGWTRRSFWLLLNEVSANTACVPTSPFSSSKLFFDVVHTNREETGSLSFKKCWAALNFRYETLLSAKHEQCDISHDCSHSNTLLQQPCGRLTGATGEPCRSRKTLRLPEATWPPPSYPFLRGDQDMRH